MTLDRGGRWWKGSLVVLGAVILGGCPDAGVLCTMAEREHHTSPDGRFLAVVYDRDCGVLGATTQLSIAAAGGTIPNAPANTFIADRLTALDVEWRAPDHLTLHVPRAVQPERADTTVVGIRVSYEERIPVAERERREDEN